ncbi:hypothetical protein BKA93DRAFT_879277, partial [Sparassis latifolia]
MAHGSLGKHIGSRHLRSAWFARRPPPPATRGETSGRCAGITRLPPGNVHSQWPRLDVVLNATGVSAAENGIIKIVKRRTVELTHIHSERAMRPMQNSRQAKQEKILAREKPQHAVIKMHCLQDPVEMGMGRFLVVAILKRFSTAEEQETRTSFVRTSNCQSVDDVTDDRATPDSTENLTIRQRQKLLAVVHAKFNTTEIRDELDFRKATTDNFEVKGTDKLGHLEHINTVHGRLESVTPVASSTVGRPSQLEHVVNLLVFTSSAGRLDSMLE